DLLVVMLLFESFGPENLLASRILRVLSSGTGEVVSGWSKDIAYQPGAIEVVGNRFYLGAENEIPLVVLPAASAPVLSLESNATVVLRRNPQDGPEVTHFRVIAIYDAELFTNDELTRLSPGDRITIEQGARGLRFRVTGPNPRIQAISVIDSAEAGLDEAVATLLLDSEPGPAFRFAKDSHVVREGGALFVLTVLKHGPGAALVTYATGDGTARASSDYQGRTGTLSFGPEETEKRLPSIGVVDDFEIEGDQVFYVRLTGITGRGTLSGPATTEVTILDNDGVGAPESMTTVTWPPPLEAPSALGELSVIFDPPIPGARWRLAGEFGWRDGTQPSTRLAAGNYTVYFRPLSGYSTPDRRLVPVPAGQTSTIQAEYVSNPGQGFGRLRVILEPDEVAKRPNPADRARWRLPEDAEWRESGDTVVDVPAGEHLLEFSALDDYARPMDPRVEVFAGLTVETRKVYPV
ncbi:MAG: hypothetical protein IT508_12605, partial [Burkholderiaceae bacterium]|nr:hypothetical protein [Burkholderiaceae bacterium]